MIEGFDGSMRLGLHVCRGNWSTREDVLISGDYRPLAPCFSSMHVRQFVLEYCTPRAGELEALGPVLGPHSELGLGVANPRTTTAEDPATIVARAEEALEWWAPERIFLNPDCGFACFASRGVNVEAVAEAKLASMAAAARTLRERHA